MHRGGVTEATAVAHAHRRRSTQLLRVVVGVLAVLSISTATARTVNTLMLLSVAVSAFYRGVVDDRVPPLGRPRSPYSP